MSVSSSPGAFSARLQYVQLRALVEADFVSAVLEPSPHGGDEGLQLLEELVGFERQGGLVLGSTCKASEPQEPRSSRLTGVNEALHAQLEKEELKRRVPRVQVHRLLRDAAATSAQQPLGRQLAHLYALAKSCSPTRQFAYEAVTVGL